MRHTVLFLFAVIVLSSFASAQNSLKAKLSEEQFNQFGLNKLSAEELDALSNWIYGTVESEKKKVVDEIIPTGDDRFGAEKKIISNVEKIRPEEKEMRSRIPGKFTGWSGNTLFKLENGQVWKQTTPGQFVVRLENPEVLIRKGLFGSYFLNVKGYGTRVKVERIR